MNGSANVNATGIKKDPADLIIGSWNDEDAEKVPNISKNKWDWLSIIITDKYQFINLQFSYYPLGTTAATNKSSTAIPILATEFWRWKRRRTGTNWTNTSTCTTTTSVHDASAADA